MTQQERNKGIALMLGKEYKDNWIVINYSNVCGVNPTGKTWQECIFHSDYNWLMDAVGFIKQNLRTSHNTVGAKVGEYFIDEWTFGVKTYYIRLIQWTDKGWRMTDRENHDLSIYYIIGENCQSEKEAIFLAVSDFAKLYNNKL
jgi:hypothetical protein